ncbi:hypothetical protein FisN_13Hh191 [Fistulifera solaris]|uniref:Uncharacterized protein n=1 Tax=Fistulifera solaris TaxID=1519565 RepID=A0A1Z5KNQ4_FISSO|nr:hypothetical protein FisN_13Hh191 [Fistulifera solaris]|eukprot:GAX27712.1 hypothetical protein FisN_13Hh191 [Fistulifera solaris]
MTSETFEYVRIPANDASPIVSLRADTKGGLTDDELVKQAKQYFYEHSGAQFRVEQFEQSTPDQRKALAMQIRQQMSNNGQQLSQLDDDTVLQLMLQSQLRPSFDIVALTIPMPGNQYQAVSMYVADTATYQENAASLPLNSRAVALITACGHGAREIRGDVFVGRAVDNEATDEWKRVNFTIADADPSAAWCETARRPGGGGGSGSSAASSLNNLVNQSQTQLLAPNAAPPLLGMNGAPPVVEEWGSWTQTNEDVEIKFMVADHVKAKDCKVTSR